jgi:hypothetical protein
MIKNKAEGEIIGIFRQSGIPRNFNGILGLYRIFSKKNQESHGNSFLFVQKFP